ncbi:MAG TPA: DUF6268 family outer membrane beta-barrel protein [Bacteroidia bacterium]|nr:DUF6268 family outer membrane beta-barrel protein [Bacteroidia bacterium]
MKNRKSTAADNLIIAWAVLSAAVISNASAQDYPAKNIYRIYVEASGQYIRERAFEDVSGLYSVTSGSLLLSVPVISKVLEGRDMTKKLFGVVVKGKGELTVPEISLTKSRHLLIDGSLSAGALYNGNKNTWQGNITASFAEDNTTLSSMRIRFGGHALFTHRVNNKFAWQMGAARTYIYGEGKFFPLLGSNIYLSARDRLALLLPMHVSWIHSYNFNNIMRVYVAPAGAVNRFRNNDLVPGAENIIYFRRREFKGGIVWRIKVAPALIISGGGGILAERNLFFSEKNNSEYLLRKQPQRWWFIEAGIKFRFGTEKLYEFMRPDELMFNETDFLHYLFDWDENQMPKDIY